MRVIAGSAKRLQLKTLDGFDTRPTTDRIKETLFNMITPYLYNCEFLDLFAGSGSIGIEALSRGAKEAVFVEKNPKAVACIRENLKYTKLENKALTISSDVLTALYRLEGEKKFDYGKYDINEREFEMIELIANGYSNKEIAAELFLSEGTVRNYLSMILEKLQLRDRTQVAVFYYQHK